MKLYMKQKVFSWGDSFNIYDENQETMYMVKGEVFSIGKKLHLYNTQQNELSYIHQKVLSFLPRFYVNQNGRDVAEVVKELTLFNQKYRVEGPGWYVEGDFLAHDYNIYSNNRPIASIVKKWFTWGDTYEIDIDDEVDEVMVLSIVLIIDAVIEQQSNSVHVSHSSSNN